MDKEYEINGLDDFIKAMIDVLVLVLHCRGVLFRLGFRILLPDIIDDTCTRLSKKRELKEIRNPDEFEEMRIAGLSGSHLNIKLKSFEYSLNEFINSGSRDHLEDVLDNGGTILGSLAGAIPGFGSFAQELVDLILKELKKRLWFRR